MAAGTLTIVFLCLTLAAIPTSAQEWSGRVGGAYVWQSNDGSESSFLTQTNLSSGLVLEDLDLLFKNGKGAVTGFRFEAWGFGDAEPAAAARFDLEFRKGFTIFADFDHRESFVGLDGSDFSYRSDDWDITRWRAGLAIDAWRPVRFEVFYRSVSRQGTIHRPMYGLNELYPIGIDLDDTMTEAGLRLTTRTLPVRIDFEQSFATYEQKSRRYAAGSQDITGLDPDLLDETTSDFDVIQDDVPTSRLTVGYSEGIFEGVASALYRKVDLASSGTGSQAFLIGGGSTGTMTYVDTLLGSAENEALAADMSLGFALGRRFVLRLTGGYRDSSSNSTLLGERLLRIGNPSMGASLDYTAPIDSDGVFKSTDSDVRASIEYRASTWAVWAGGLTTSRETSWRRTTDGDLEAFDRDGDGLLVGVSFDPGPSLGLSLEIERGDFSRFIFRTDPENVDRASLRLRSRLGKGWHLNLNGRYEKAENPSEVSDLDYESTPWGVAVNWSSDDGRSTVGLDLESYTINSRVGLVLPGGDPGRSDYDLDLFTATIFGGTRSGVFGVDGSLSFTEDGGESWPMDAWNGRVRFTIYGAAGFEYAAFAQYWSYDEQRSDVDDFDVLRYGLAIHWRFE